MSQKLVPCFTLQLGHPVVGKFVTVGYCKQNDAVCAPPLAHVCLDDEEHPDSPSLTFATAGGRVGVHHTQLDADAQPGVTFLNVNQVITSECYVNLLLLFVTVSLGLASGRLNPALQRDLLVVGTQTSVLG